MTESTSNPKLYRQLSEPFAGRDLANAALESFRDDLEVLREKHKIADVVAVIQVNVADASGEEGLAQAILSFGDPMNRAAMLAYALGTVQNQQQELIGRLLKGKR
jgi:hypothetical protein